MPRSERRTVTACTWSSAKWPQLAGEPVLVQASVGRIRDERALALRRRAGPHVHGELARAMGIERGRAGKGEPLRTRARAIRGRPSRALARIDAALAELPGVHLAGAAYRGVGVGACMRDGESAALAIAAALDPAASSVRTPSARQASS